MPSKRHSKSARSSARTPLSVLSSRSSNRSSNYRSRMFSVAVQPPTQTRTCASVYPPVVVRGRASSTAQTDAAYAFAMVVLKDGEGNVLSDYLAPDSTTTTGIFIPESRNCGGGGGGGDGSSGPMGSGSVAFLFPDLAVPYTGSYSIRVDIYKVDYDDPHQGAVLVDQVETRRFVVYDADVPVQGPSSEERSVMRKLRDQGHCVPSDTD